MRCVASCGSTSFLYSSLELRCEITKTEKQLRVFFVLLLSVPARSPAGGGDVAVYTKDINQPTLPTPSYSVLVSISVFAALSTEFHSMNSLDNSPLSHSVLLVFFRLTGPLNYELYISL